MKTLLTFLSWLAVGCVAVAVCVLLASCGYQGVDTRPVLNPGQIVRMHSWETDKYRCSTGLMICEVYAGAHAQCECKTGLGF